MSFIFERLVKCSTLFLLLLLPASAIVAQVTDKEREKASKPGIWRVTKQYFNIVDGRMKLVEQSFLEFNLVGNLVRQIYYTSDSLGITTKSRQIVYQYDANGRHLGTSRFNGQNVLEWSEEYFFDNQGQKIRAEYSDYTKGKTPMSSFSVYEYDINGNQAKVADYDQQGALVKENGWTYNEFGDIESSYKIWYVKEGGKPVKKKVSTQNKFDKSGNLIKSTIENSDGTNSTKEVRVFENNFVSEWLKYKDGQLISRFKNNSLMSLPTPLPEPPAGIEPPIPTQDEYMSGGAYRTEWANSFEYDQYGNTITAEKKASDGDMVSVFKFDYDENHNLIRTIRQFTDRNLVEETLMDYDEFNNIANETLLKNGIPVSKVVYLYDYFSK